MIVVQLIVIMTTYVIRIWCVRLEYSKQQRVKWRKILNSSSTTASYKLKGKNAYVPGSELPFFSGQYYCHSTARYGNKKREVLVSNFTSLTSLNLSLTSNKQFSLISCIKVCNKKSRNLLVSTFNFHIKPKTNNFGHVTLLRILSRLSTHLVIYSLGLM